MKNRLKQMFQYDIDLETRVIYLDGQIGADEDGPGIDASDIVKLIHVLDDGENPITIKITSYGGSLYEGMAIYDAIRLCKSPTITVASGYAMSMAAIILQAGDTRVAEQNATIMIHDGSEVMSGTPTDIKSWTRYSQKMCQVMYKIFSDRSGKTMRYWKSKCSTDYVMIADEALAQGLVDKVV